MIKVLVERKDNRKWIGQCNNCGSIVEADVGDLFDTTNVRGSCEVTKGHISCPVCKVQGNPIPMNETTHSFGVILLKKVESNLKK